MSNSQSWFPACRGVIHDAFTFNNHQRLPLNLDEISDCLSVAAEWRGWTFILFFFFSSVVKEELPDNDQERSNEEAEGVSEDQIGALISFFLISSCERWAAGFAKRIFLNKLLWDFDGFFTLFLHVIFFFHALWRRVLNSPTDLIWSGGSSTSKRIQSSIQIYLFFFLSQNVVILRPFWTDNKNNRILISKEHLTLGLGEKNVNIKNTAIIKMNYEVSADQIVSKEIWIIPLRQEKQVKGEGEHHQKSLQTLDFWRKVNK